MFVSWGKIDTSKKNIFLKTKYIAWETTILAHNTITLMVDILESSTSRYSGHISALMFRACSVNSQYNIPFVILSYVMYLFANSPTGNCWHTHYINLIISLQTYITAVGHCFLWWMRTLLSVVILHQTVVTLRVSDFTLKCIGVFVILLLSENNRKKQSTQGYYWFQT